MKDKLFISKKIIAKYLTPWYTCDLRQTGAIPLENVLQRNKNGAEKEFLYAYRIDH